MRIIFFIVSAMLLSGASLAMNCAVRASCNGNEECLFSVVQGNNSHVGECAAYSSKVCCDSLASAALRSGCFFNESSVFTMFGSSNAHGSVYAYGNNVCVRPSSAECALRAACLSDETAVVSLYAENNSHVGAPGYYSNQLCCALRYSGVAFSMEFNISGAAGDSADVDGQSAGFYDTASSINNYYVCSQDAALPATPAFGIMFSGRQLNYINLTSGDSFKMTVSQKADGNRFVIPVTMGCSNVREKFSLIRASGILTQAIVPFVSDTADRIQILLRYSNIDIVGDLTKTGSFTLNIEKNESGRITQLIFRD